MSTLARWRPFCPSRVTRFARALVWLLWMSRSVAGVLSILAVDVIAVGFLAGVFLSLAVYFVTGVSFRSA